MKVSTTKLFYYAYAVVFCIALLLGPEFRYSSYAYLSFACIMLLMVKFGVLSSNRFFNSWLALLLIIIGCSTIANLNVLATDYYYRQTFLLTMPILFCSLLFSKSKIQNIEQLRKLESMFIWSIISIAAITALPQIGKFDLGKISIINSTSPFESGLSHLMGMLVIFCLVRKRKGAFMASLFFMILFNKRIAIAATILIILLYVLIRIFPLERRFGISVFLVSLMNVIYFSVVYDLMFGGLFEQFFRAYTGFSLNQFTLGRYQIYQDLSTIVDIPVLLAGKGIGQVNIFLRQFALYEHIGYNPHSDVLRIILEFGLPLGITWIFFLYKKSIVVKNMKYLLVPVYVNMLMFTDNVVLYHYIMIPFFIISFFNLKEQLILEKNEHSFLWSDTASHSRSVDHDRKTSEE